MTTTTNSPVENLPITAEYSGSGWGGRGDLQQLNDELTRQRESRIDVTADTRQMEIVPTPDNPAGPLSLAGKGVAMEWFGSTGVPLQDAALRQMGDRLYGIPGKFLSKLAHERPRYAANLLNSIGQDDQLGRRHFVRQLDGKVRAVLSDRYRVLDHLDLAMESLAVVQEHNGHVLECSLSDKRMVLKFVTPEVFGAIHNVRRDGDGWYAGGIGSQQYLSRVAARSWRDMPVGDNPDKLPHGLDTAWPIVTIRNSETGHGRLEVRIGILLAACFNLATVEATVTKQHVGGVIDADGIYSDETRDADSKATWLKIRDNLRTAFNPVRFQKLIAKANAANCEPVQNPTYAVEQVVEKFGMTQDDRDAVLQHFLRDYQPTRFGLSQAVARHAQDCEGGDRAADLEDAAGSIFTGKMSLAVA